MNVSQSCMWSACPATRRGHHPRHTHFKTTNCFGSFSLHRDRPPSSFHRQLRGSASLYLAIECRRMELLQMSLKCSMSFCNHRPSCTADVGCWFLFASWQSSAVMRARKVSLRFLFDTMRQRHLSHPRDAPYLCTTASAAWSLRLGVNSSSPWVALMSVPSPAVSASGRGIFGCSTSLWIAIGFLLPCSPSPLAKARTRCEATWDGS